ncbi:hypothetical protein QTP86_014727 [Hemibagrus guttatus]|nr:hypothetical protein QTP86_014727 [Hemibagrus guttatus]
MAQRKVALAFTGLYVLLCQGMFQSLLSLFTGGRAVWAKLEMEDRVEVFLGDVAEINCIYKMNGSVSSPMIQWFVKTVGSNKMRIYWKNESGAFVERGTGFSDRINVSDSQEGMMGNSILTINALRATDARDFICQVNMEGSIEEGRTQLKVFNAPSQLVIEAETYASVAETLSKIATCEVSNGYPTPKITWYRDRSPLYTSDDVDVKNRLTINSNDLYSVQSELYLTVVKEDKDAYFYCEVTYLVPGAEKMIESQMVNITIHYPTSKVEVIQDSPKQLIKEGDRVELRCEGDGNPQPIKSFMHNNDQITPSYEDRLVLHNVTRLNSGLYECSCLDTITYDSIVGNMTLMVHYLDPVVITPENPDSLDEGQDLSLLCNALSSLSTHAFWYKDSVGFQCEMLLTLSDNVLLNESNVLTLHNASVSTAGTYHCEVVALELPELNRSNVVHVSVRGKPMITKGVEVIPLDTEKFINVSCHATGHPTPTIHWSLSDDQAPLGRWDTKTENSVHSIISISHTSDITASCRATNDLGTTETSHQIQARGNGYIIAIIIIFILLLAVLGSVLYFMYKKGKISCGRSGKQDLTKEKASSDDIVVEIKSSKSEEAVLLQGVNGDKKASRDQFD